YALNPSNTRGEPKWELSLTGRVETEPVGLDLDADGRADHIAAGTTTGEVVLVRLRDGEVVGRLSAGGPLGAAGIEPLRRPTPRGQEILIASRNGALRVAEASSVGLRVKTEIDYGAPLCGQPVVLRDRAGTPLLVVGSTHNGLVGWRLDGSLAWATGLVDAAVPRGGVTAVDMDGDERQEIAVSMCARSEGTISFFVAVYDQEGRLRRKFPMGEQTYVLGNGVGRRLIAEGASELVALGPFDELGPPQPPTLETVAHNVLAGAYAAARAAASKLPPSFEANTLAALAAWHLDDRKPLQALMATRSHDVQRLASAIANGMAPSAAQEAAFLAPLGLTPHPRPSPPPSYPPSVSVPGVVRGADFSADPIATTDVTVRSVGLRTGGLIGSDGWVEMEFLLEAEQELSLALHHQSYVDYRTHWSPLGVFLNGGPVVPFWSSHDRGSTDRFSLGKLAAGMHKVRVATGESLTLWRVYDMRLIPGN
ncbi:hypothetical protein OAX78_02080, partial [Planctomycetota bacterium]|nr:hypothetical protein [Planctomycetota bacterium]